MDAQKLIETAKASNGFVPVTFPKTALGILCLRNLRSAGAVVNPNDKNEVANVLSLNGWGHRTTFSFTNLGNIAEDVLYQLAKDIVSAG